jgi:uncharacterized protein YoxC
MYRNKIISMAMIVPMTMFIGCAPSLQGMTSGLTNLSPDNNATQDGEQTSFLQGVTAGITDLTKDLIPDSNTTEEGGEGTALQSAAGGALLGGAIAYWQTGGDMKKVALIATAGAAVGYLIGQKLAEIQKNYKGEENALISNIIKVEEESINLRAKNEELTGSINAIENEITILKENKLLNAKKKTALTNQLQEKRNSLESLLTKNQDLSSKISNSKSKVEEYEYTDEHKQDLLSSVDTLSKQVKTSTNAINKDISSIDNILASLA